MRLLIRGTFGEMVETLTSTISPTWSPSMIHLTPTKTLLTTTCESLVMQLAGSLAQGTRLIEQFVHAEPKNQWSQTPLICPHALATTAAAPTAGSLGSDPRSKWTFPISPTLACRLPAASSSGIASH